MRYFTLAFLFITVVSKGQDTTSTTSNPMGHRFIISLSGGLNFPGEDYGDNTKNFKYHGLGFTPEGEFYGYSLDGSHFDFSGTYMPSPNIGLIARIGVDNNGLNNITQYQAGLRIAFAPIQSNFNFSLIGLIGLVAANIHTSNSYYGFAVGGGNITVTPRVGTGLGYYIGGEFTAKVYKKIYLNLSAGYLGTTIDFPSSAETNSFSFSNTTNTTTTTTDLKMITEIVQTSLGISYHL